MSEKVKDATNEESDADEGKHDDVPEETWGFEPPSSPSNEGKHDDILDEQQEEDEEKEPPCEGKTKTNNSKQACYMERIKAITEQVVDDDDTESNGFAKRNKLYVGELRDAVLTAGSTLEEPRLVDYSTWKKRKKGASYKEYGAYLRQAVKSHLDHVKAKHEASKKKPSQQEVQGGSLGGRKTKSPNKAKFGVQAITHLLLENLKDNQMSFGDFQKKLDDTYHLFSGLVEGNSISKAVNDVLQNEDVMRFAD